MEEEFICENCGQNLIAHKRLTRAGTDSKSRKSIIDAYDGTKTVEGYNVSFAECEGFSPEDQAGYEEYLEAQQFQTERRSSGTED